MTILGISAFFHDSAASVVIDGKVICAFEEERFSRIKHDGSFPRRAIQACLRYCGIDASDIDLVAYYERPTLRFERVLEQYVDTYPSSLTSFVKHMPGWLGKKLSVENIIRESLVYTNPIAYVPHHLSHAAAAFYTSGLEQSAVLTMDGVGEYMTTGLWSAEASGLKLLKAMNFPDSVGLFYSTFTGFLGFPVNEGEYRMMGLAAYGEPTYVDAIRNIVTVHDDGSITLNRTFFVFDGETASWRGDFKKLFGTPRKPHEEITARHKDIAASVQKVTGEIYFNILNHLHSLTGGVDVCIGGGVALNSLANGGIHHATKFARSHIFGPSGDNGAAIGAALQVFHERNTATIPKITTLCLGNDYEEARIQTALKARGVRFEKLTREAHAEKIARILTDGSPIACFQGRAEFGPRALGNRSILCDATRMDAKERLNTIKRREDFRPFAISVLEEHTSKLFETPSDSRSFPFMNYCFKVQSEWKDKIAGAVHEDGTCRIQSVSNAEEFFYTVIAACERINGIPAVINTSFNESGQPIVETPEEAVDAYVRMRIPFLSIGDYLAEPRAK